MGWFTRVSIMNRNDFIDALNLVDEDNKTDTTAMHHIHLVTIASFYSEEFFLKWKFLGDPGPQPHHI